MLVPDITDLIPAKDKVTQFLLSCMGDISAGIQHSLATHQGQVCFFQITLHLHVSLFGDISPTLSDDDLIVPLYHLILDMGYQIPMDCLYLKTRFKSIPFCFDSQPFPFLFSIKATVLSIGDISYELVKKVYKCPHCQTVYICSRHFVFKQCSHCSTLLKESISDRLYQPKQYLDLISFDGQKFHGWLDQDLAHVCVGDKLIVIGRWASETKFNPRCIFNNVLPIQKQMPVLELSGDPLLAIDELIQLNDAIVSGSDWKWIKTSCLLQIVTDTKIQFVVQGYEPTLFRLLRYFQSLGMQPAMDGDVVKPRDARVIVSTKIINNCSLYVPVEPLEYYFHEPQKVEWKDYFDIVKYYKVEFKDENELISAYVSQLRKGVLISVQQLTCHLREWAIGLCKLRRGTSVQQQDVLIAIALMEISCRQKYHFSLCSLPQLPLTNEWITKLYQAIDFTF